MEYLAMIDWNYVLEVCGMLAVVMTAVAQIYGKIRPQVDYGSDIVWKIIAYAPTFGLNPNTRALKRAYDELNEPGED